jgi:hypothetical protein
MYQPATKVTLLPGSGALLTINGTAITSHPRQAMHSAATTQDLREYYQQKHQWDDNTIDEIDWEPYGSALHRLSHHDRISIQKFNTGWLPTQVQ